MAARPTGRIVTFTLTTTGTTRSPGASRFWSRDASTSVTFDSANRNPAWTYDAEANLISRNEVFGITPWEAARYKYDAAGREVGSTQKRSYLTEDGTITHDFVNVQVFDGDGQLVHYSLVRNTSLGSWPTGSNAAVAYLLRSTVLSGRSISEYDSQGTAILTHVYSGAERIGQQVRSETGTNLSIWQNDDPVTGDGVNTITNGSLFGFTTLDPAGAIVGESDPFPADGSADSDGLVAESSGGKGAGLLGVEGGRSKCVLDGLEVDCSFIRGESSVQCPNNDCGPRQVVYQGERIWAFFQAFGDGYSGYVPSTARYIGNGGVAPAGSGGRPRLGRMTGRTRGDTILGRLNGAQGSEADLRYNYSAHTRFLTTPQNPAQPDPCTIVNADMGEGGQGWYRYPQRGPRRLDYGQPGVVAALTNLASDWNQRNPYNPIGIGDLSQFGGGFNNMHPAGGHMGGVVVDIRPMRNDQVNGPTNYHDPTYDPVLTQVLVNDLLALRHRDGNPAVQRIIFNDPNIVGTDRLLGDTVHDNHLHVVFRSCP